MAKSGGGGGGGGGGRGGASGDTIAQARYGDRDIEDFPTFERYGYAGPDTDLTRDVYLGSLLRDQGFDGRPHVANKDQLDRFIAQGEIELFRGVRGGPNGPGEYADQFRDGELFPGLGIFGNGTYTARDVNKARGYADPDGAVMRMSLKRGARVVDYIELQREMIAEQARV